LENRFVQAPGLQFPSFLFPDFLRVHFLSLHRNDYRISFRLVIFPLNLHKTSVAAPSFSFFNRLIASSIFSVLKRITDFLFSQSKISAYILLAAAIVSKTEKASERIPCLLFFEK